MATPETFFNPHEMATKATGGDVYPQWYDKPLWLRMTEARAEAEQYQLDEEEWARIRLIQNGAEQSETDYPLIEKYNTYAVSDRLAKELEYEYASANPEYTEGETIRRTRALKIEDVEGGRYVDINGDPFASDAFAETLIDTNNPVFIIGGDGTIYPMNETAEANIGQFTGETENLDRFLPGGNRMDKYIFRNDEAIGAWKRETGLRPGDEGYDPLRSESQIAGGRPATWRDDSPFMPFTHESDIPESAIVGRENIPAGEMGNYYIAGQVALDLMPGTKEMDRQVFLPIGSTQFAYDESTPGDPIDPLEPITLDVMGIVEPPEDVKPPPPPTEEDLEKDPWDPDIARGILAGLGAGLADFKIDPISIDPIRFDQDQYGGMALGPSVMNLFRGGR